MSEQEAVAHPAREEPSDPTAEQERVEEDLDALADTKRERDEYLELAQRTRADFENYKKRVARESAEAERRGMAKLVRELLPVVDNLERALAVAESEDAASGVADGIRLVLQDLRALLERTGVESYDPAGEPFDPSHHEAITSRSQDDTEPGVVLEVVDKGYRLNGQVLRPARVVVSG